jgi:mono/diheme cytochrome c family protein
MGVWKGRLARVRGRVCVLSVLAVVAVPLRGAGSQESSGGSDPTEELAVEGQAVFGTSCVSCHDADGGDGSAPALNGHPSMGARDHIVRQILRGNAEKGMPAFAATLSDRQVAAVATYIRNAWDNVHGVVLEGDVKKVRDEGKAD